ncbi:unnamed protein product [Didymodactylos carnosus]|uniref:Uncharacterized protein n=1 Tax=Didymodactylos carnosus TaxID=1234261 RepID=A0A814BYS4_9BILA|nr:unnamed protein product [Didymodactylos carnosus]CAF0934541.1 unnamed protein product [Didymodactylos carnosus]CAF3521803.1 unnamed protein product [Didymodactylos carnosus]CAF3711992.1 unnamed protein product [Didymodactylos carnosus]
MNCGPSTGGYLKPLCNVHLQSHSIIKNSLSIAIREEQATINSTDQGESQIKFDNIPPGSAQCHPLSSESEIEVGEDKEPINEYSSLTAPNDESSSATPPMTEPRKLHSVADIESIESQKVFSPAMSESGITDISTTEHRAAYRLKLHIPNAKALTKLVAARLDLPSSRKVLEKFPFEVVKRCYEDQFRLKHDDFVTDCDLLLACTILAKQIQHIGGKIENIVIPSIQ